LSGAAILELTGWSLDQGIGYWPMLAICAGAYLAALAWIQLIVPVIRAGD
jgi:ACS family hexuronate transporter-like MFS transporter